MEMNLTAMFIATAMMCMLIEGCDRYAGGPDTYGQRIDRVLDQSNAAIVQISDKVSFDVDSASTVLSAAAAALHNTGWITTNPAGDEAITDAVRSNLRKDPDLGVLDVEVETREGVVWLHGSTYDHAARQRAEGIAKSSRGVTKVLNRLIIKEV